MSDNERLFEDDDEKVRLRDVPMPEAGAAGSVNFIRALFNRLFNKGFAAVQELSGISEADKTKIARLWPEGYEADFQQENVGDCYFLAGLYGLHFHPLMPYLAVKTIEEGSTEADGLGWNVDFLGGDGESVFISEKDDLHGQVVVNERGRRVHKLPLRGQLGDVILERAFGRHRKVKDEKRRQKAGGRTMDAIVGGHGLESLKVMLGDLGADVEVGWYGQYSFNRQPREAGRRLGYLFQNVAQDPDGYVLTAGTVAERKTEWWDWEWNGDWGKFVKCYYLDPRGLLCSQHAYTVFDVDFDGQKLTVVDPHDTKRLRFRLTFEQFKEFFANVSGVRFDKERVRKMFPEVNIGQNRRKPLSAREVDFSKKSVVWPKVVAGFLTGTVITAGAGGLGFGLAAWQASRTNKNVQTVLDDSLDGLRIEEQRIFDVVTDKFEGVVNLEATLNKWADDGWDYVLGFYIGEVNAVWFFKNRLDGRSFYIKADELLKSAERGYVVGKVYSLR